MKKTIIEEFVQKARSNEQQFTLKQDENWNFFFTKVSIGEAACVYGTYGYGSDHIINDLDKKLEPYAIVSSGKVYIIQKYKFGLTGAKEDAYPSHAYSLDEETNDLNKKIEEELFPSFYNSLPIRELTADELEEANKQVRDVLLAKGGETKIPTIRTLINRQTTANILYDLVDFNEYIRSEFDEEREHYITVKSINKTIDKLAREVNGVEKWELKLNSALRELESKTVTVEFDFHGRTTTTKFERKMILRKLNDKDYFSSYDFPTVKNGENILTQLGAGKWRGIEDEVLTCEHINKITFGKKVVFSK